MAEFKKRQSRILELLNKQESAGTAEIKKYLEDVFGELSRITVIRNIDALLKKKMILRKGSGRSVKYISGENKILRYFDVDEYFKKETDERQARASRFDFGIFKELKNILTLSEIKELTELNNDYKKRIRKLPPAIIKRELERLTIELSWKSSQIEGNTYSLLDTEVLIKEHKEAKGHKREEAIMILNHKKALDYILDRKSNFTELTLLKIDNIHKLVVAGLNVASGLRKKPVGIVGTIYQPLDNEHQLREAMQKFINVVNGIKSPLEKALLAILMISYIQPFEDGNKRTARLLGNALLLAYNFCPLSFRSIDAGQYKKAVILFYEQQSARYFKELFIEQFRFSIQNYFKS